MQKYVIIRELIFGGEIEEAIGEAEKDIPLLYFALDRSFQKGGTNCKNGLIIANRILDLDPQNVKAQISKLILEGKVEEAIKKAIDNKETKEKVSLLFLINCLCLNNEPDPKKPDLIMSIANRILDLDPQNVKAQMSKLILEGQVEEAIKKAADSKKTKEKVSLPFFVLNFLYQKNETNSKDRLIIAKKIQDLDPTNVDAHEIYGNMLCLLNRYSEAEYEYYKGLNSVDNEESLYKPLFLMNCLYTQDMQQPKDWSCLKPAEKRSEILAYLANMLEEVNRLEDSRSKYEEAIENNPENIWARTKLGHLFFKSGKYEEAKQRYEEILNIYPNFFTIQLKLGDALYELMKYEESIEIYKSIIQNYNTIIKNYKKNIEIYKKIKDSSNKDEISRDQKLEEAWEYRIKKIEEKLANVYDHLGKTQFKLKKYVEAKDSFEKTVKLNPHHSGAYNNLGMLLKEKGDSERDEDKKKKLYEDAREKFNQSLNIIGTPTKNEGSSKRAEKYAIFSNNLGIVLSNLKENSDAKEYFKNSISVKSNFVDSYVNLGALFAKEENYDEAIKNFEIAISLDPNNFRAYSNLMSAKSKIKVLSVDWWQTSNWKIFNYALLGMISISILVVFFSLIEYALYGSQDITERNETVGVLSNITTVTATKKTVDVSQTIAFIGMMILLLILPSLLDRIKTLKISTTGVEFEMESPKESDSDTFDI